MQTLTLENLLKARAFWTIGVECGLAVYTHRLESNQPDEDGDYKAIDGDCIFSDQINIPATKDQFCPFATADEVRKFVAECFPGDSENEVEARAHVDRKIAELTPQYDKWMAEPLPWEA